MALRMEGKKRIVKDLSAEVSTAVSAVLANYKGLTVDQMTRLRQIAREQDVQLHVVRNTLAKHAFGDTDFECLQKALSGPTLLAVSQHDLGSAARMLDAFSVDNPDLKIKALSIGGEFYGLEETKRIASLPTRTEALTQLVTMLQAPLVRLVRVLNAVPTKLVGTVAAIKDQAQQKQAQEQA